MSRDNPLVNTHQYFKPATTASKGNQSQAMHTGPHQEKEEEVKQIKQMAKQARSKMAPKNEFAGGYIPA